MTDMVMTIIVDPDAVEAREMSFGEVTMRGEHYLDRCGLNQTGSIILSDREAVDLFFEGERDDIQRVMDKVHEHGLSDHCDVFIQPVAGRRRKMLIADMDSTMIQVECIDELADFAGLRAKVEAITEAAMQGELDFNAALRERVALLKGMETSVLQQCYDERVVFTKGARSLVRTMARDGALTVLVSGGFTFFTSRVSEWLGFDINKANVLGEADGKLTGKVDGDIVNAATKQETLEELSSGKGLTTAEIIAVGDGANDIPMIEAAGLGAAFHAKPKARDAADFAINHTSLASLLFIQGYSREEFSGGE